MSSAYGSEVIGCYRRGVAADIGQEIRDELVDLEHRGWTSLCDGTGADFYGDLMTDDGVMVLAHGMALDRDQVVESLREAPTWDSYGIEDVRTVALGEGSVALVYRGSARRESGGRFVALMTSAYVRVGGRWRLALYTQTPVPD